MNDEIIKAEKPFRNKKWSEMNDKEHNEKLRLELVRLQKHVAHLSSYITKLIEHDHMNGRMVTRLSNPNEESYGGVNYRVEELGN